MTSNRPLGGLHCTVPWASARGDEQAWKTRVLEDAALRCDVGVLHPDIFPIIGHASRLAQMTGAPSPPQAPSAPASRTAMNRIDMDILLRATGGSNLPATRMPSRWYSRPSCGRRAALALRGSRARTRSGRRSGPWPRRRDDGGNDRAMKDDWKVPYVVYTAGVRLVHSCVSTGQGAGFITTARRAAPSPL